MFCDIFRWYVEKGLGDVLQEDPLVVKLRFEPAGRPQQEGNHGYYYLQVRDRAAAAGHQVEVRSGERLDMDAEC